MADYSTENSRELMDLAREMVRQENRKIMLGSKKRPENDIVKEKSSRDTGGSNPSYNQVRNAIDRFGNSGTAGAGSYEAMGATEGGGLTDAAINSYAAEYGYGPVSGQGAGGSGGLGAWGTGGVIAAAIAAQHAMSKNTDTEFEGQKTRDAFSGHMMTEPWQGFAHDVLGFGPTPGEKFDASVANEDWGLAARRLPEAANYWADPIGQTARDVAKEYVDEDVMNVFDPVSWFFNLLGGD